MKHKETGTMNGVNRFLAAVALTLAMVMGALGGALAQSGKVVVYSGGGSKVNKALTKAFKKAYPNIGVEILNMGGGEALTRVRAEKDNPRADVLFSTVEVLGAYPELFDSYKAVEHDIYPAWAVGADNKHYGIELAMMIFIVNTKLMPLAEAPKSWKDLADAKFKGKIIMANPSLSGSAFSQLAQMIQLYGWDIASKVIENAVFVPKSRLAYSQVAKGEYPIGLTEESRVYAQMKKGFPVAPVYPAEGTAPRLSSVGIIKGGPNPENAKIFFNWRISKAANEIQVKVRGKRVVRSDVKARGALPPIADVKTFDYDASAASAKRAEILAGFNERFAKKN